MGAIRVAIAALLLASLPVDASAKWTQLRSANFLFVGDAPAGQIRRVAQRLEQFREVLVRALPGATATSPVPTIVIVFETDRSLTPVKPLFRGNTIEVGGYFQGGEDRNYIAVNGEHLDIALMTVFHEYSHFLIANSVGRVPSWVGEGLAEFYSMLQESRNGMTAMIGLAPRHHIDLLKESTLIPIRELLAINQSSQVYNEGLRRGVFYAESWALTHYLTLGNKERATQFRQYLGNLRIGVEHGKAFDEAFAAANATLDRELFDYVRQFSFPALRMDFAEKIVTDIDRGATMDDLDAAIYVADLQARIGREAEGRARLQGILAQRPGMPLASSTLGLIDLRAGRVNDALPRLERAAEEGVNDSFVQHAFGRALISSLNEQTDREARAATVQKARAVLSRAAELDGNSANAAWMLGYIELVAGTDLARAVDMLERAARLAPSRDQYRLLLAQALLQQGQLLRATDYLGPLVASGSSPEIRSDARRLLGETANRRARAASAQASEPARGPLPLASLSTLNTFSTNEAPRFRLDLRVLGDGETRVLGVFRMIECRQDQIVLHVDSEGRLLRIAAKQLAEVDFVSYRSETPGSVGCGALSSPLRVLATYRANAPGAADTIDGIAVAIELLPDGYTPP